MGRSFVNCNSRPRDGAVVSRLKGGKVLKNARRDMRVESNIDGRLGLVA